jgi:hypothetical protein
MGIEATSKKFSSGAHVAGIEQGYYGKLHNSLRLGFKERNLNQELPVREANSLFM